MSIRLKVNGEFRGSESTPDTRLLDYLRGELRLTGAKEGCGEGECGACAVLLDGQLANSCLIPLGQLEGAEVVTIEGLPGDSPLARAFGRAGGTQCGICTPGMMLAATALLAEHPRPSLDQVRAALDGNLCRCTGYTGIYAAIAEASGEKA